MSPSDEKVKEVFLNRIKEANQIESTNPLECYNLLSDGLTLLQNNSFPLSNRAFYEQTLIRRLDYLKNRIQTSIAKKNRDAELEIPLTVDNTDMDSALDQLNKKFNQKAISIETNEDFSDNEKRAKMDTLKKWKNDKELQILIDFAGGKNQKVSDQETQSETIDTDLDSMHASDEISNEDEILEEKSETNPYLVRLQPTEIENIWEYYFLHSYKHPTPNEFYGAEEKEGKVSIETQQYISRMFHQVIDHYGEDFTPIQIQKLPGSSKFYFIGDLFGNFEAVDRLLRFFMPKIFEAQATEQPLRLVFLGNFTGGNSMDFHVLLYLICFKLLYPKEVIFLRGPHEDAKALQKIGLEAYLSERFDTEILKLVLTFFSKLPIAFKIESDYKPTLAVHGCFPIDIDNPTNHLHILDLKLEKPYLELEDMGSLSQQVIYNQLGTRMDEDVPYRQISKSSGYKINQSFMQPLMDINDIDLMVTGNITVQSGHKLYGGNLVIALISALEYQKKQIHGKFLEMEYPADPEYPEYPEAEPEEEELEEKNGPDADEIVEEKDPVILNLMDVEAL